MNMKDLEYFIALAEKHSFTAVAKTFSITQPSVTYAIKRLEEHFQTTLIIRNRSHQTISLTPTGITLYHSAKKIFNEYQFALSEIALQSEQKLTIGLPPIIATYYAEQISTLLLSHHLLEHVQTIEQGSLDLLSKVNLGQLDIALIGSDKRPEGLENVQIKEIARYPFVLISANQDLPDQMSFKDIDQHKFILLNQGFTHHEVFTHLSEHFGVHPLITYQTSNLSLLKNLVRQQGGMSFLTTVALTEQDHDLKQITLVDPDMPTFNIYAVMRQQDQQNPLNQEIEKFLDALT